ncbi:hypothetical protein [Streptomyces sp. NPDC005181]|uniref:hypothetical protein n=1 Tax=Streptomyces sp. NPDC005181 TaxID=3156869 RepID=UPI0033AC23AB
MSTDRFDQFAATGTGWQPARIRLADGHMMSVQAGPGAGCLPRPTSSWPGTVPTDYPSPYTHLEVFLWPGLEGPDDCDWDEDPVDCDSADASLYLEVPVEEIRAFVLAHGGEHADQDADQPAN